ncbi:MAG: 3-oxoadipate enol-lactonase [Oxalobacteraceae bacterium]|nr:3-oxoadipate enol-lactonase [Oxalobacteraceae bacterium]
MNPADAGLTRPQQAVFADQHRIRTLLDIEAALASALAQHGVISENFAAQIAHCCRGELISTGLPQDVVRQLTVAVAGRDAEAANYVHWGMSLQDLSDTALVLQLRVALDGIEADLARFVAVLAEFAERHRHTAQVGRVGLQHGLPITFGLKTAGWLDAMLRHQQRLQALRVRLLTLQFGGATGTLASLGDAALPVATALAATLDLSLPDIPWHGQRDRFAEVATTLGLLAGSLGKIAHDMILLTQTEVAELAFPVMPSTGWSATLAATQQVPALVAAMLAVMLPDHEGEVDENDDAAARLLPQIVALCAGALEQLQRQAGSMKVDAARMQANLALTRGRLLAEPLTLALARKIGRQPAEALVRQASAHAAQSDQALRDVLDQYGVVSLHFSALELDRLLEPASHSGQSASFVDRVLQSWQQSSGTPAVVEPACASFAAGPTQLHYRMDGPPDAPWLVLSNALGTALDLWEPQMPLLSEHFHVLRYDTRGHGQSVMRDGATASLADLGDDVISLMDHLGIARAHFCGSSLGGMIGLWLAIHHPGRIERLVVCNAAPLLGPPSVWDGWIEQIRQQGVKAIVPAFVERWFTRDFERHAAHQVGVVQAMLLQTSPAGLIAGCTAIRDMDLRSSLPDINVPTLVIGGKRDRMTPPAQTRRLAAHINGASYVELNAGHLPNREVAQRFNAELTDFLLADPALS